MTSVQDSPFLQSRLLGARDATLQPRTLDDLGSALRSAADANPHGIFANYGEQPLTFAYLDRQSDALAAGIYGSDVRAGSRILVMMSNSPELISLVFAIVKAGFVWIPVNVKQRGDNLKTIIEKSAPDALVVETNLLDVVDESGADLAGIPLFTKDAGTGISLGQSSTADNTFPRDTPAPNDPFAIMYTSGTTGPPKGVVVTHRMLSLAGEATLLVSDAQHGDVFFVWEPMYHIGGAQLLVLPFMKDLKLHLVDRFSASRFWQEVCDSKATHVHYLGGVLQLLLRQPRTEWEVRHSVRVAWGGGCPAERYDEVRERFGIDVRECYGMTEASSITTYSDGSTKGVVGKPVPWFDVEILDDDGKPVNLGDRGEIVVSSEMEGSLFPGYFREPETTAKSLKNGRLYTGDQGSIDSNGMLRFYGRMSDSVRCGGENVSAWEVEHVVLDHPAVEECAIVGVASEFGEQDIKLFLRLSSEVGPKEICDWLDGKLAKYMMPRYITFVDEFEKTGSQRIIKHKLSIKVEDCWDRFRDGNP